MKEQKDKIKWMDFWMYVGSKDERIRALADKAGHISFHLVLVVAMVDFLVRSVIFHAPWTDTLGTMIIFFGGTGIYALLWIVKGGTVLDTQAQKKKYTRFIIAAGFIAAGLSAFLLFINGGFDSGKAVAWWVYAMPLASGILTIILSLILVQGLNHLALRRAETLAKSQGLETSGDQEPPKV